MKSCDDHVGEIVANLRSNNHISRSMILINLMARSLDVKMMSRKRKNLQRKMVATYAVGRMVMQGALN